MYVQTPRGPLDSLRDHLRRVILDRKTRIKDVEIQIAASQGDREYTPSQLTAELIRLQTQREKWESWLAALNDLRAWDHSIFRRQPSLTPSNAIAAFRALEEDSECADLKDHLGLVSRVEFEPIQTLVIYFSDQYRSVATFLAQNENIRTLAKTLDALIAGQVGISIRVERRDGSSEQIELPTIFTWSFPVPPTPDPQPPAPVL